MTGGLAFELPKKAQPKPRPLVKNPFTRKMSRSPRK